MKIKADEVAKTIAKTLEEYEGTTVDAMKKAVDKAAKQAVSDLKVTSPKRTGAYAKDWAAKNDRQKNKWAYAKVVYNKKHYRLTHLLEKGHKVPQAIKGKRWVDAIPHIADVEQEAINELVKEIKDNV